MIFVFFVNLDEDVNHYLTQYVYLLGVLLVNDLLWFLFNVSSINILLINR